jgi:small conductance mechanosensitive channel
MRNFFPFLGLLLLAAAFPIYAQEQEPPAELQSLPADQEALFYDRIEAIGELKTYAASLEERLADSKGLEASIISARLQTVRTELFDATLTLASDVAAQQQSGFDVADVKELLREDLKVFPEQAAESMQQMAETVKFDYSDLGPKETVVNDRRLLRAATRVDAVLASLISYTEIAANMDLDATDELAFLDETLREAVASRSVFLEVAISQVALAKGAATTLPADEELPLWVAAAEARVRVASTALQSTVNLMNRVGMDTRQYRQQIVTATGELTTDVLDVGVVAGIIKEWSQVALDFGKLEGPRLLFRILLVAVIVLAFGYLSKVVARGMTHALQSSRVSLSHLLKRMIVSTTKNLVFFVGLLFALSQLGISLGPLLAGLGIAGFIIGFALQDTLSNFASGLMILIYRPFDVGDFVEGGGVTGKVDRMSLVNTTFKTLDNQVIIVPNNMIWQNVVINVTAQRTRRVDLTFGISYSDDIDKAKAILRDVVDNYDACLSTPEPNIRVGALGESSVDLICRPWVKTDDYWDTYWNLTEIVKKRFDEEGISIPFPQRDVHMIGPEKA